LPVPVLVPVCTAIWCDPMHFRAMATQAINRSLQMSYAITCKHLQPSARMWKTDSKSAEGNLVGVRPPLPAPKYKLFKCNGLASDHPSLSRLDLANRKLYLTCFGTISVQ
jgi:hypothetical protein